MDVTGSARDYLDGFGIFSPTRTEEEKVSEETYDYRTYDEEKALRFMRWLVEGEIDFSMDRSTSSGDRNEKTVEWTFYFDSAELINYVVDHGNP